MPHQFGKNYRMAAEKVEAGRLYPPREALELVRATSMTTYDPTVEAHFRLGIAPRHADQAVRTTVVLPHGTGRTRRIAVFATGEKAREALDAGADLVGGEDLVKQVQAGQIDFDVALATPDVMGLVGRLGNLHAVIGKASFDDGRLGENFAALMDAIIRAKPPAAKGTYLKTVTLCTTHGPAIKVDPAQASKLQVA